MKKWMAIVLTVVMIVMVTACGANQNPPADETTANETTVSENVTEASEGAYASEGADMEALAGEYKFYGTYINEQYAIIEELEGTSTTLDADGTGYLNWGEDNKGPVSKWSVENNHIVLEAGISTMTGMIGEGVLLLEVGDEEVSFLECYVREDADLSKMPRISAEEWAEQIAETLE